MGLNKKRLLQLIAVCCLGFSVYLCSLLVMNSISYYDNSEYVQRLSIKQINRNVSNVMLIGVDSFDKDNQNIDFVMIVSSNLVDKRVRVSTLLGQSEIDHVNGQTITLADSYQADKGSLFIKKINEKYLMDLVSYVMVDSSKIPKIIDVFGGLDPEVAAKKSKAKGDYWKEAEYKQEVLISLFSNIKNLETSKQKDIFKKLRPYIKSPMTINQIFGKFVNVKIHDITVIECDIFPRREDSKVKKSVVFHDIDDTAKKLYRFIFGSLADKMHLDSQ